MTRRGAVEAMLRRYGSPATAGCGEIRAVIRPLRYQSGAEESGGPYFRYTGPAGVPLAAGDTVETPRRAYRVQHADTAVLDGEELYVWAVLKAVPAGDTPEIVFLSPDGTVLAHADAYTVKMRSGVSGIYSWGEGTPSEIAEGETSWELDLTGVWAEDGQEIPDSGTFTVEFREKTRKTVYAGCRVKNGEESGGPGEAAGRTLSVLAASRTEEAVS